MTREAKGITDERLRSEREFFSAVLDTVPAMVVVLDREGRVVRFNRACEAVSGYTCEEVCGQRLWSLLIPPHELASVKGIFEKLAAGNYPCESENHWLTKGGSQRLCAWKNTCLTNRVGQVSHVVCSGLDITERREDEQQLQRLNRTLSALNSSNQALMRASNEEALLREICRIIVEDCGHAMVWIGFAENDVEKSVLPVAYAGFSAGYIESLRISWADTERGRGPTGTAIRTGSVCLCRNMLTDPTFAPWREDAVRCGFASSIALPITCSDAVIGALTLYSAQPNPFSEDEVQLLSELAGNLSFGISSLRLRLENAATVASLRESEARFRTFFESASDGIFISDATGRYVDVNGRGLAMLGLSRGELLGRSIADVIAEHERQRLPASLELVLRGQTQLSEWQFMRKDGSLFPGEVSALRLADGRILGILRDLTERQRAERDRDLTIEFLRLVNDCKTASDLLKRAVTFFKEHVACDAAGIRLKRGCDFPYQESQGFSEAFLTTENSIAVCGTGSQPNLACLCGKVIRGDPTPQADFFTEHGTFWSVKTADLLSVPFKDTDHIRSRCIHDGFGSLALLPLHAGTERMGLLQLNFKRENAFTPEALSLWERLAAHLAVAISKFQAEDALRLSRSRFQTLAAATFEGIAITEEGRIVDANTQLAIMLGFTRAELLGKHFTDLFPAEDQETSPGASAADGDMATEHRLLRKDGRIITVEAHSRPSTVENRRAKLTTIRDITARRQSEALIQEHVRALEAMNAELTRFNHAAVDRELRMIQLKKEINELRSRAGLETKYALAFEKPSAPERQEGER